MIQSSLHTLWLGNAQSISIFQQVSLVTISFSEKRAYGTFFYIAQYYITPGSFSTTAVCLSGRSAIKIISFCFSTTLLMQNMHSSDKTFCQLFSASVRLGRALSSKFQPFLFVIFIQCLKMFILVWKEKEKLAQNAIYCRRKKF